MTPASGQRQGRAMKLGFLAAAFAVGLGALAWQVRGAAKLRWPAEAEAPSAKEPDPGSAASAPSTLAPSPAALVEPPAPPAVSAPPAPPAPPPQAAGPLRPLGKTNDPAAAERKTQLTRSLAQEEERWDAIEATPEERQRARAIFVKYFELQEGMDEELLEETISKDVFKRRFFERLTREAEEYEAVFGAERARKLELESRSATD